MIGLRGNTPAQPQDEPTGLPPGFDDPDFRLGDLMRGERATMGKSLLDVQRELRIRASYVAAIENADISAFDTPSFIAGYVRSYARYLGMDSDWTFRRFCQESGFQPTHGMAPAASGPKPQRRPSDPVEALANPHAIFLPKQESFWSSIEPRAIGSVLVMVMLACGLGYGGWTVLQEVQKVSLTPGEQTPGVVASLDPVQEAAEPETVETAQINLPRPEGIDRTYRPQALEVPVLIARDGPIAAIDPGLTNSAAPGAAATAVVQAQNPATPDGMNVAQSVAAGMVPAAPNLEVAMGPGIPAEQAAVRTVAPDAPEVEILAVRPAWVRVTSADGTVLLEKTMDAGERFALPKLEAPPILRAGNSGGVYFAVNGQTYGPAAPGAKVVKNVELSANSLTTAYAFADPAKDPELAEMIALASAQHLRQPGAVQDPLATQQD
ncbi:helix-turn-helix domain-containing protein [Paracoccus sulfuroxidans]|uniref:Cytoskeletal protein RodZ n=1 Tax=Paracoccus sulfuroxidans TaxID=384678 RepID=A0A562NX67_9RHOB|nr:helix-turn-helix domain-containing protein [Paracoccus sulfuroxidans]TWI36759.1 cytoskeletal protein RodZ [Paracoccus sulfuroxidans]